jgi:hypothetical protein
MRMVESCFCALCAESETNYGKVKTRLPGGGDLQGAMFDLATPTAHLFSVPPSQGQTFV